MRQRMRDAHRVPDDSFDLKHSPGGMIDVEFAVQYLVLAHAARHPALRENTGNIALLRDAEQAGLLPPGLGEAAGHAYRMLRHAQHRARLDEASMQRKREALGEELTAQIEAVHRLWRTLFE